MISDMSSWLKSVSQQVLSGKTVQRKGGEGVKMTSSVFVQHAGAGPHHVTFDTITKEKSAGKLGGVCNVIDLI